MKKFHFIDGLKIGGIENQALSLSSLETSKVENFLINLNKRKNDYPDNFFNQKKYKNLKVISFERKQGLLISFIIFKKFRKYKNSDFIIYFNNMTSLWVIIGAKFAGISNIAICIQNSIIGNFKENFKTIILIKIFNKFKVKLVPCSKAVLNSYLKIDNKIKFCNVIPNCIDVKIFQREVKMIKKNRKLGKLKTISMIARLDDIKDQETLIRAYSKVKKKCRLLLIGDGKKKSKLEKIALSLKLEPKEIFLGSRNDIHNILANSDIFAFSTTDAEGFGIVILEAMAAGLPIIATDVSACREVLDNGDAGILVPINREDLWIKEITNLLNSKKLRDTYINKSAKNIQNYDSKNIILKWNNLFLK
tara:strand:- start:198 stop:1286 length:1089 start_codon:yes stop_codon:yes gene_type:complete